MLDEAHSAWRGEDDGGSLGRLGVQRARHDWTDDISTRDQGCVLSTLAFA